MSGQGKNETPPESIQKPGVEGSGTGVPSHAANGPRLEALVHMRAQQELSLSSPRTQFCFQYEHACRLTCKASKKTVKAQETWI